MHYSLPRNHILLTNLTFEKKNLIYTSNPNKIPINDLNNFHTNFPSHNLRHLFLKTPIEERKPLKKYDCQNVELHSPKRLEQTIDEFFFFIDKAGFILFGENYFSLKSLNPSQIRELAIYLIKNKEYTYYDLTQ